MVEEQHLMVWPIRSSRQPKKSPIFCFTKKWKGIIGLFGLLLGFYRIFRNFFFRFEVDEVVDCDKSNQSWESFDDVLTDDNSSEKQPSVSPSKLTKSTAVMETCSQFLAAKIESPVVKTPSKQIYRRMTGASQMTPPVTNEPKSATSTPTSGKKRYK